MIKNILIIISVSLFSLSCDRRDCLIRASHMEMDYQYCNSLEGREAVKKAYDKFLSNTGEIECRNIKEKLEACEMNLYNIGETECGNTKEKLEACEMNLYNLEKQLDVNIQNTNSMNRSDWKK
jgi:hypothetical protein